MDLDESEKKRRAAIFYAELGYMVKTYDLHDCLEFVMNLDETAVRMKPEFLKVWLRKDQPRLVSQRISLTQLKNHTTRRCGLVWRRS